MRNVLKKCVAILLIASLLTIFAGMLVACNNDDNDDDLQQREGAVAIVKDAFLKSADAQWQTEGEYWQNDLSNDALLSMKSAGDYVVTKGWTDLVGRVLVGSSLQTPKLALLADYMQSSQGQALLDDFSQNAELIITLLKDVGFTSADISSLVYCLLKEIVSSTKDTFDAIISRLYEIKNDNGVSVSAIAGLNTAIADITKAQTTYDATFTSQDEAQLLVAIEDARGGISELVAFAYNMSISQITDNIFNSLFESDGALSDITDDEVRAVVGALINNVTALKAFFNEQETAKMNGALELIIDKFDTQTYMSSLFGQVVTYAKYAYMALDAIPAICDIAEGAAEAVDNEFIVVLRQYVENVDSYSSEVKIANTSILFAKLWDGVCNNLGESGMNAVVDKLYSAAQGDYQKATPLFGANLVANVNALINKDSDPDELVMAHPDVLDGDAFVDILNVTVILGSFFPQFKAEYFNYVNGDANALKRAHDISLNFSSYIQNPYNSSYNLNAEQTERWYQTYVANVTSYLNATSSARLEAARDDLKLFVGEYFAQGSEQKGAMDSLKELPLLANNASAEDISSHVQKAKSAGMYWIVGLVLGI